MKILFCHGLESGPHGSKYKALVAAGYTVVSPDCRGMGLEERVAVVAPILEAEEALVVVGSSFGGVVAVLAALKTGKKLKGLVLCAPALGHAKVPLETLVVPFPVTVIHGTHDDVIPLEQSLAFAAHQGCDLIEVNDDHFLSKCEETILAAVARF